MWQWYRKVHICHWWFIDISLLKYYTIRLHYSVPKFCVKEVSTLVTIVAETVHNDDEALSGVPSFCHFLKENMTTDKPKHWETVFEESFHHHNRPLTIILSSARLFTNYKHFSHRNLWFWLVNCWYDDPTTDCKWKLRFCICRFNLARVNPVEIKQLRPAGGNEIIFTTQSKGCTHPYTHLSFPVFAKIQVLSKYALDL